MGSREFSPVVGDMVFGFALLSASISSGSIALTVLVVILAVPVFVATFARGERHENAMKVLKVLTRTMRRNSDEPPLERDSG
jgi:hypothetical protein